MARYDGIADWHDTEFLGDLPDHGRAADGLRARVVASHLPLGEFVSAFTSAGLRVEHFEEDGEDEYPYLVALVARR